MIAFVELQQASALVVHGLGFSLLVGRIVHAYGVSQEKENYKLRTVGMGLTFGPMLIAAVTLIRSVLLTS